MFLSDNEDIIATNKETCHLHSVPKRLKHNDHRNQVELTTPQNVFDRRKA